MTIKVTYNVTDVYMSQSVSPVYINVSYSDGGASGGGVWGSITGTLSNQTDLQTALDAKLDESTIDGGTEGQILSKASATDFDFAWINNYAKYLATNVRNQTGSTIGAFQVVYISGATGNKPLISLADADTEATSSKTYGVTATSIANNGTGDVVTAGELSGIDTSAFNEGDLLWLSTTAGGVVTSPPAEPAHAVFIGYVVRSHPTLGVIDVAIANGYELNELHGVQITSATNNDGLFYNSTSTLWENKSITTALGYTPVPTTRNITINGVTYDLSADRTWTIAAGISGSGAAGQVTYWTGTSAVSGSNNLFWDNANGRLGIGTNTPAYRLDITSANIRVANFSGTNTSARLSINNTTTTPNVGIGLYANNIIKWSLASYGATSDFTFFNDALNSDAIFIKGSTNNVILGGSTTDNGQKLQVQGTTLLNGNVTFSSATGMFWDATNSRLGIGTNAPQINLHIGTSTGGQIYLQDTSANSSFNITTLSNTAGNFAIVTRNSSGGYVYDHWGTVLNSTTSSYQRFFTSGSERMRIFAGGNIGVGSTTDSGERLQVTGNVKIVGSGNTGATTALTVQNSDANGLLTLANDGILNFGNLQAGGNRYRFASNLITYTNGVTVQPLTFTAGPITFNASVIGIKIGVSGSTYHNLLVGGDWILNFSADASSIRAITSFSPTSGNARFSMILADGTINQTGGANGITRGLYINPTLTSAADFRAIETTNGKVIFGNLPTSSAGLPTGAIWNNGGVINIV